LNLKLLEGDIIPNEVGQIETNIFRLNNSARLESDHRTYRWKDSKIFIEIEDNVVEVLHQASPPLRTIYLINFSLNPYVGHFENVWR